MSPNCKHSWPKLTSLNSRMPSSHYRAGGKSRIWLTSSAPGRCSGRLPSPPVVVLTDDRLPVPGRAAGAVVGVPTVLARLVAVTAIGQGRARGGCLWSRRRRRRSRWRGSWWNGWWCCRRRDRDRRRGRRHGGRGGDGGRRRGVSTARHSLLIGRLSQCAANGARSHLDDDHVPQRAIKHHRPLKRGACCRQTTERQSARSCQTSSTSSASLIGVEPELK